MRNALIAFLLLCCAPARAGVDLDSGDYYVDTTHVLFTVADQPFSVSVWVRQKSASSAYVVATANPANNNNDFELSIGPTGRARWESRASGSANRASVTNTTTIGTWVNISATQINVASRQAWGNGDVANKGTNTGSGDPAMGTPRTGIGTTPISGIGVLDCDAEIAYLTVWHGYQLTDADAVALAAGAHPFTIAPDKIKYFFPLAGDGPVGTRVRDRVSGVLIDDTVVGTPTKTGSPLLHPFHPFYGLRLEDPLQLLPHLHRFTRCREEDYALAA